MDVDALINRGGSPSGPRRRGQSKTTPILLRVPADMMDRLDTALRADQSGSPATPGYLEAIHEKLSRDLSPQAPKS